jgi:LacI family transcriptional regulator
VVTLVTDIPGSGRLAYVGIDNRAAGATAAYLVDQWLGDTQGDVLVTLTRSAFRGEEEREVGFRATLRDRGLVVVPDTEGLDVTMLERVSAALEAHPGVRAVYSIGGGNRAVLDAFGIRECAVFIAHDLDEDNVALLRAGRISAVLHHDLGQDMRHACHVIMQAHGALPGGIHSWPSSIQVVTPYNAPQPPPPERR